MAFEKLTTDAKELYTDVQDLIKSNIEYAKLELLQKSAKGTIALIKILVLSSVFLFALIFLSIGVSFWIGEEIGSIAGGFLIVGGFYLLLMLIAYLLSKTYLEKLVLNKFSEKIYKKDEAQENI